MYIVVSYDIPDDRRRTRICKLLKGYGEHVQESVFDCDLRPADYRKLRERLQRHIKPDEDNVRFYSLCQECKPRIDFIGATRVDHMPDYYAT